METLNYADDIQACSRGDRAALRRLFEAEGPRLVAVAQRIVRRRELAEEAVQEGFVQIWQNASRFDPRVGSARSWIYAIIRYRALSIIRDEGRSYPTAPEDLERMFDAEDADTGWERLPEAGALRRCLEEITPVRRSALILSYVEGLTHGEVAGRLRIPLGTAKSWIRRALSELRECME